MGLSMYILVAMIALLVASVAAWPLVSKPLAGAALIVAIFVVEALLVTPLAIPLGLLIYPEDIVFVLLFAATTFRYARGMAKPEGVRRIILFLFLLFFVALARGFASNAWKDAGVESRGWFYFLSGVAYFSSFDVTTPVRKKLVSIWLIASMALVALAIFRWLATVAGLSIVEQWEGVGASAIRVLNASHANFLAIGFFASAFLNVSRKGPYWQRKAFYLIGPVLLLLQHRTVWVQIIIGVLWLGLQDARFRKKAIGAIVAMAIIGTLLVAILFGSESGIATASLQNSAGNDDTLVWRVAGWYELLFHNPARNPLNDTIGQPFGTGYDRTIGTTRMGFQPHNYYVEAFLRVGIIGLCVLVLLYIRSLRRLKAIPPQLRSFAYPDARFWAMVLILQMLFFLTYAPTYDQSILAGIAMTGLRLRLPRPVPRQAKAPQPLCARA